MKNKVILILLFFAFQLNTIAQHKSTPCPIPRYKIEQTPAQVSEDTRIYIECRKKLKAKESHERQERENEKKNDGSNKHVESPKKGKMMRKYKVNSVLNCEKQL